MWFFVVRSIRSFVSARFKSFSFSWSILMLRTNNKTKINNRITTMLIAWNVDVLEILKDREREKNRLQFTYNIFDVSSVFLNLKIIEKKSTLTGYLICTQCCRCARASIHAELCQFYSFLRIINFTLNRTTVISLGLCPSRDIHTYWFCAWVFVISFQFKSIKSFTHFLLPFKLYLPCRVLYYCVVFDFFFLVDFQFHSCW